MSGSTRTTSVIRTSGPIMSMPGGRSSTGRQSASATRRPASNRPVYVSRSRQPAAAKRKLSTTNSTMSALSASVPDVRGRFGRYGGRYVPETLMEALRQLTDEYEKARVDSTFQAEFQRLLHDYVGRPSRLYFAERLTNEAGGARIYLKREDLNHTGAHKINNSL